MLKYNDFLFFIFKRFFYIYFTNNLYVQSFTDIKQCPKYKNKHILDVLFAINIKHNIINYYSGYVVKIILYKYVL